MNAEKKVSFPQLIRNAHVHTHTVVYELQQSTTLAAKGRRLTLHDRLLEAHQLALKLESTLKEIAAEL